MRRLVVVLGVGALLIAGTVFAVSRGGGSDGDNPHAGVGAVPPDELDQILNAVETAESARSRAALVAEGRRLFRSSDVAKLGESCDACHVDGGGTNSELGTILHPQFEGDFTGPRDVSSLWGVAETPPYGWAGQEERLADFVIGTIRSHFKEGEDQAQATTAAQTAALVAYLETLTPPATAFDQGTLTPAARRGEALFQGKGGCIDCHSGPLLTDNAFHDTLVPKVSPSDTDAGAPPNGFNTPHLRDVRNTAPYMHNGSLATLRDVVDFYNRRSSTAPLRLTQSEINDLVAYLESL